MTVGTGPPKRSTPAPPKKPARPTPATSLREAEDTATGLLRANRETLDRVIALLLERETIDGADLAAIVGAPLILAMGEKARLVQ